MNTSKNMYKKRHRQRYRYIPLTVALMAVALLFGMNMFLKVKWIEIEGAEKYTDDEILAACGSKPGDSLLVLDGDSVAANIKKVLPYIDRVDITKQWPSTLVITVRESRPTAVIEKESGGYYKINRDGRVLEEVSQNTDSSLMTVIGIKAADCELGEMLKTTSDSKLAATYAINTLAAISDLDADLNIEWIDVADAGNIKFECGGFSIELGSGENVPNKLAVAIRIMEDIGEGKRGRIIVKDEGNGRFVPTA